MTGTGGTKSCTSPLTSWTKFRGLAPFRAAIEDALKKRQINPSELDELTVQDAQMQTDRGQEDHHAGRKHHATEGIPDLQ